MLLLDMPLCRSVPRRYRKIFNDALNLRLIRSREPFIRSVIVQLLAPIAARGGGELVSELAIQLPIRVISGMLGLQEHTTSRIRTITEQLWMTFGKERDPAPLRELFVLLMDEANGTWQSRRATRQPLTEASKQELRYKVGLLANMLRAQGVQRGDRVVSCMPNIPETLITFAVPKLVLPSAQMKQ